MQYFQETAKKLLYFFVPIVLFVLPFQGCDSTEPTGSSISLSFSTPNSISKILDDTIELDSVKILLKDIKLGLDLDSGEEDDHFGNEEEVNVKVGPFVVYLNLNGMTTNFAVSTIPEGTYNEIKFKIHKIEASQTPPDPEFKDGDDSSLRYSVIVKGIFNSQPFIYKSRKSAHQKIKLDNSLIVEANTSTNLTITVDPSDWFVENGIVLDPNDPSNQNIIDNNIKDSFKRCYKDNDHNGGQD